MQLVMLKFPIQPMFHGAFDVWFKNITGSLEQPGNMFCRTIKIQNFPSQASVTKLAARE